MALTITISYRGQAGAARAFAREMTKSGTVDAIRAEDGCESYAYYLPLDGRDDEVLLVDRWRDQAALDAHHQSPLMAAIAALRDKYDLHMEVHRYEEAPRPEDDSFIRP